MPSQETVTEFNRLVAEHERLERESGFLPERIGIVRRLVEMDPANAEHRNNQGRLEALWLRNAQDELAAAVARNDQATIALYAVIITNDGWVTPPPPSLSSQVAGAQTALQAGGVLERHTELLGRLKGPQLEDRLQAWNDLARALRDDGIDPLALNDPRIEAVRQAAKARAQQKRRKLALVTGLVAASLLLIGGAGAVWFSVQSAYTARAEALIAKLSAQSDDHMLQKTAALSLRKAEQDTPDLVATAESVLRSRGGPNPIETIRRWQKAWDERREKLVAEAKRLAALPPEQVTSAHLHGLHDLHDLHDLMEKDNSAEEAEFESVINRLEEAVATNNKRKSFERTAELKRRIKAGLAAIAAAPDVATARDLGAKAQAWLTTERLDQNLPREVHQLVDTVAPEIATAVKLRTTELTAAQATADELKRFADPEATLTAYLDRLESFAKAHSDHPQAPACTNVLKTRAALMALVDWDVVWSKARGDRVAQANAARTMLESYPDLANATALRALTRTAGDGDLSAQVTKVIESSWWTGWKVLSIAGKSRVVPANWTLGKPPVFGGKMVMDVPTCRTLAHIDGRQAPPIETLRIEVGTAIDVADSSPHLALAATLSAALKNGQIAGPGSPLTVAAEVAAAKGLDPLYQVQALRQVLAVIPTNLRDLCPEDVRTYLTALDGVGTEPLWLRPDEAASQQAAAKATALLTKTPGFAAGAKSLTRQVEAASAGAAPWIFVGRVVREAEGPPTLELRPGQKQDGRLLVCVADERRQRWVAVGSLAKGVATPGDLPADLPNGTPVLLAP